MSQRILSLIVQDKGVDATLFETNIRECRYVRSQYFEFPEEPEEVETEAEVDGADGTDDTTDDVQPSPLIQTLTSLRESFGDRYETIAVGLGSG